MVKLICEFPNASLNSNVMSIRDYEQMKVIGRGAYGEVWLVKHKNDKKQYVLKKLDLRTASIKERRGAEQEAKLLSRLKHPNIVTYKDSFESAEGFLYIAMGYCEAGDLYGRLKDQKGEPLPERQIVEWFVQIAMALQYLHTQNIMHRDLKTQNIFLTKSKIIKVGDLGIARVLESSSDMAKTLIGTPYYMSPEIFSNRPYNFKSDVWALGCCVYEMTTLKHAFNGKDINSLMYRIQRGKMPQMPNVYSEELINLIKAMLQKSPEKRPTVNRILRDPYIKKNIAIFLEETKKTSKRSGSNDRRKERLNAQQPAPKPKKPDENLEPLQFGPELEAIVEEQTPRNSVDLSRRGSDKESEVRKSGVGRVRELREKQPVLKPDLAESAPIDQKPSVAIPHSYSESSLSQNRKESKESRSRFYVPISANDLPPKPEKPSVVVEKNRYDSNVVNRSQSSSEKIYEFAQDVERDMWSENKVKNSENIYDVVHELNRGKDDMKDDRTKNSYATPRPRNSDSRIHESKSSGDVVDRVASSPPRKENRSISGRPLPPRIPSASIDAESSRKLHHGNGKHPTNSSSSPNASSSSSSSSKEGAVNAAESDPVISTRSSITASARERRRLKQSEVPLTSRSVEISRSKSDSKPTSGRPLVADSMDVYLSSSRRVSYPAREPLLVGDAASREPVQSSDSIAVENRLSAAKGLCKSTDCSAKKSSRNHQSEQSQLENNRTDNDRQDYDKDMNIITPSMKDNVKSRGSNHSHDEVESRKPEVVVEVDSSESSSDESLEPKERDKQRSNKEMNKFISLLGTLTLFAKKDKSEDISDEDIEPEEEKPAPDVVSKSTRKNVSRNATFVRLKPSPLPPGSKYPYIEEVAPTNDEVEVFDEEPELPQNQSNKSSLESGISMTTTGRLFERITSLRKDCIRRLGVEKLKFAYDILDCFDTEELEPKLVELLGQEDFDIYAGKIMQLKFCEESAFGKSR